MDINQIWAPVPWATDANSVAAKQTVSDKDKGILGKDDFLKILITELKYQDPMEPMKDKEFIAQMATFSSLEQMKNLNTSFEKMAGTINDQLIPSIMLQQAGAMIGKQVAYLNPELTEDTPSDQAVLTGQVSSVMMKDGKPIYVIGEHEVEFTDILEMGQAPNLNNDTLEKILNRLDSLLNILNPEEGETDA